MKHIGITMLVLAVALGAASVSAAQTGSTSITLKGHTDSASYWTQGDAMEHNPTISVPANTEITVSFTSVTGTHNLKIGSGEPSAIIGEGDAAVTQKFTSGADGTDTEYICTIHGAGMAGKFHVGSVTATTKTDDKKSPGFEVVALGLAVVGIALLLRRK